MLSSSPFSACAEREALERAALPQPTRRAPAPFVPTAVPVSHDHPCDGATPVVAVPATTVNMPPPPPASAHAAAVSGANENYHAAASNAAEYEDTKWDKQKVATVLPELPSSHNRPGDGHGEGSTDTLLPSTPPYYRLPLPEEEMNIGAAAQHRTTAAGLRAATTAGKAAADEERQVARAQREETVHRDDARRVRVANATGVRKAEMWDEGLTVDEWAHRGEFNKGEDQQQQKQAEDEADGKLRPYKQQTGKGGYEVNKYDVAEYETGDYEVAEYKSVYD